MARSWILGSGLLLVIFAQTALTLRCWTCSSNQMKCGEPFDNSTVPLNDCPRTPPPNSTAACQTLKRKDTEQWTYVRGCAWIPDSEKTDQQNCLRRNDTAKVETVYCLCDTEGCNSVECQTPCNGVRGMDTSFLVLAASVLFTAAFARS